jgi:hypothetical protein
MITAIWVSGIACAVALGVFLGITRMHKKTASIGTSPLK